MPPGRLWTRTSRPLAVMMIVNPKTSRAVTGLEDVGHGRAEAAVPVEATGGRLEVTARRGVARRG